MTKIIITTVGTSLLTNLIQKDNCQILGFNISDQDIEDIYNGELEEKFTELPEYCKSLISAKDVGSKKINYDKDYNLNLSASAEIKSICKIANGEPTTVYLLATDTFMSEYVAEQIALHLDGKNGLTVESKGRISGLKIDAPREFEQRGFEELIKVLDSIRQEHENDEVILNISGGYKALIPFLTIYAQLESLPIKYIYENSDEVISLESSPLNFDWGLADAYYEYLQKPELLKSAPPELQEAIKKSGLIAEEGSLSALGNMLEKYISKHLPQRSDVLGWYMEHKLFECFFRKPFRRFQVKSIGREFFYDPQVPNSYSEKKESGLNRIEIDIELKNDNSELFWIECKSFSKRGKAINQIKKALKFKHDYLKEPVKHAGIFIYKYSFQDLTKHFYQKLADDLAKDYGVKLIVFVWDIPFSFQKSRINYKNIFETKIELEGSNIIEY